MILVPAVLMALFCAGVVRFFCDDWSEFWLAVGSIAVVATALGIFIGLVKWLEAWS